MKLLDRITVERGKCGWSPCIRGYRLRGRGCDAVHLLELNAGQRWEFIFQVFADHQQIVEFDQ